MIEKLFIEKFELLADSPAAVTTIRELVLDCAGTGRLWQSDSVEWQEGILGDVIQLISGQHLLAHEHNGERLGIPYLTGPSDFGDKSPIPTRWTEQPKVTADPGDILITVKGAGVGKTNVLIDQRTAISRQLMAIRVTGAFPEFVHIILKRAARHFRDASTGIAIPGIGRREVLGLKICLPPLAEQKRIVAKVDELMALCDELEAQQREREERKGKLVQASLARFAAAPTPDNLQFLFHNSYDIPPADLRKMILTLAVQGKLVRQEAGLGTAESHASGYRGKHISQRDAIPTGPDDVIAQVGLGYPIPASWQWVQLSDLLAFGPVNGFSPKAVDFETGTRSLTLSATTSGTFKPEHVKFIVDEIPQDSYLWLQDGDILVQRGNTLEYVGVAAIYRGDPNRFIFPDLMMKIRLNNSVDESFVHLAMSEETARNHLRMRATGTSSNMPKINQSTLKALPLPLPPLAEQRRIVAKVTELMALVDELQRQLEESRAAGAKLLEAIVRQLTVT